MSEIAVKWKDVERFFSRTSDYEIRYQGGDAIILKRSQGIGGRGKLAVRIGHNFLNRTKELTPAHLRKIERTFGVTREDILK